MRIISNIKKFIYIFLGFLFMGIGIIGIVLPLVPTTPLLLLASFFFVKGSKKFEIWFKSTKIYKKYLEEFVNERAMTLKQKISTVLLSDCMIAFPFLLTDRISVRIVLILMEIYKYYYFFCKIKTIKGTPKFSLEKENK
ncbi:YbaN family protein [Rossellomorea sp. BNER]|uniref:YbaN family protein n=1 Tax=Rossellomorea sp. BNER TaxID=2962031 RepID=UPI003AF2954E